MSIKLQNLPKISVVVPVYNTPPVLLDACLASVIRQTYSNWELCICDDASSSTQTQATLDCYRGQDPRIRIVRLSCNANISKASNVAAEQATGQFLAFLDHDDCLHLDALGEIAEAIAAHPDVDLIYTDEDKLAPDGSHIEPYFKPDWSPDHLFSVMYVLHCLVIRKQLFWELSGFRPGYEGAQDYDLVLRAAQKARRISHIPKVLYHWRINPGSSAGQVDAKPYALTAAQKALREVVSSKYAGTVETGLLPGTFRVRYPIKGVPEVTLVIFTGFRRRFVERRGHILLAENFVRSILSKSSYPNYRIFLIHDGRCPKAIRNLIKNCNGRLASFPKEIDFNFSRKVNFAFARIQTEHFILLNDDLEVINSDWIESLLEHSQRGDIGAVGPHLLFADGSTQHAGIVCGIHGSASHIFHRMPPEVVGYNGFSHLIRNYSAVTAAALATRMSVVEQVGPLDERLPIDFNDIDFCLRVRAAGYRIVYTPYSALYHFEGSSILRKEPQNARIFCEKWADLIERDPYYNPNLPRDRLDFGIQYQGSADRNP